MPGIGQPVQQIGAIDPSSLIGNADPSIVEPRAVAELTNAFHQGLVTADDIVARLGDLGKGRKKAQIMLDQEAVSPEAQAARAQGLATQTAVGQAQQAEAERARVLMQFPAVAYFDKFAAAAGIQEPKLEDGMPDYKQMERIGAELAVDMAAKAEAQRELDNIVTKDTQDGNVLSAFTKQGEFVDPARVQALRARATKPFSRQAPGTAQTAPAAAPVEPRVPPSTESLDVIRARLANQPGADTAAIVGMSEEALRQPSATAAPVAAAAAVEVTPRGSAPVGASVPGGVSLGNAPKPVGGKSTMEQDKAALALGRFADSRDIQASLAEAGYDPTSYGSWINSLLPQVLKAGDRKLFDTAAEGWIQGLLRLESGAAIGVKEKQWYVDTFFPAVKDPPSVVAAKEQLRGGVERAMAEIALKGGVISPDAVRNAVRVLETAPRERLSNTGGPSRAAGPAPVLTLKSGARVQRDAAGNFQRVD